MRDSGEMSLVYVGFPKTRRGIFIILLFYFFKAACRAKIRLVSRLGCLERVCVCG